MKRLLAVIVVVLVAAVAYGQSGQSGWNVFGALPTIRLHDVNATDRDTTAAIENNCAVTTSGAEDCSITLQAMANGALVDFIDAAGDGVLAIGDGTETTIITFNTDGADASIDATGNAFLLTATTTATATFIGADAASPANTTYDTTGAGLVIIGSGEVARVLINTEGMDLDVDNDNNTLSLINSATGSVILDFRDYADTTDDDMAHALISSNCTTATTGAEECDLNMNITTGGAAIEVVAIDPAGGIEFGDATTTAITLTTDDTGDGTDLVLPANSVNASELNGADVCGGLFWAQVNPTEASATDDFLSMFDHGGSTTEGNEDLFLANDALLTFHSMRCDIDVAPGVGNDTIRVLMRDDGGDTAVVCDIDETATSCTSGALSAAVAAGSLLNFDVSTDLAGDGDGDIVDTAALITCSVCMGP